MTDQANLGSHPWRRFLRFSVRGMIVLVLVIGGWLTGMDRAGVLGFSATLWPRYRGRSVAFSTT